MAVVLALSKGRFSKPAMLRVTRQWGALALASGILASVRWVLSERCAGDPASRGRAGNRAEADALPDDGRGDRAIGSSAHNLASWADGSEGTLQQEPPASPLPSRPGNASPGGSPQYLARAEDDKPQSNAGAATARAHRRRHRRRARRKGREGSAAD